MTFSLSDELQTKIAAMLAAELGAKAAFASLSDADLAASARFWLQHCETPQLIQPDQPAYDSTFWHAIVPEIINRLSSPKLGTHMTPTSFFFNVVHVITETISVGILVISSLAAACMLGLAFAYGVAYVVISAVDWVFQSPGLL